MDDVKEVAAAERHDLADLLETLSPEEWQRPSLCVEWSVRDVAAHVSSYDELGWGGSAAMLARSRFSLDRANAAMVEKGRRLSTPELVRQLREHAVPRGPTAMFGGRVALTDGVIHHQDIRRALDRPRQVPPERLREALAFMPRARALPAPSNLRGLRAVATDVDWSHGSGPEVRGSGEALLLGFAGRVQALADLTGPGVETLAARLR